MAMSGQEGEGEEEGEAQGRRPMTGLRFVKLNASLTVLVERERLSH